MYRQLWWEIQNERDHWEDLDVGRRIIQKKMDLRETELCGMD
jgi:hypothetical protein